MGKPSLDEVLAMYARGEITACTAAEMLGIPLAKFYELWAESGMTLGPEWAEDLMDELRRLGLKKPFARPSEVVIEYAELEGEVSVAVA